MRAGFSSSYLDPYGLSANGIRLPTEKHAIGSPGRPEFHLIDQPSDNTLYYNGFPADYPRTDPTLLLGAQVFTSPMTDEYVQIGNNRFIHGSQGPLPFALHYGPDYGRFFYAPRIFASRAGEFDTSGYPEISDDIFDNDRFDVLYEGNSAWPFNRSWIDYTGTSMGEYFHYLEAINNLSYYPPALPGRVPLSPLISELQPQLPLGNNGTVFPDSLFPPAPTDYLAKAPFYTQPPIGGAPAFVNPLAGGPVMSVNPSSPAVGRPYVNPGDITGGYRGDAFGNSVFAGAGQNANPLAASLASVGISPSLADAFGGLESQNLSALNSVLSIGAGVLSDTNPLQGLSQGLPTGAVNYQLNDVFAETAPSPLSAALTNNPISGPANPYLNTLSSLPGAQLQDLTAQYFGNTPLFGSTIPNIPPSVPPGFNATLGLANPVLQNAQNQYVNNSPLFSDTIFTPAPSLHDPRLSPGLYPYTPGVTPNYNQFTPPVPGLPANFFSNPYSGYFPPTVFPATVIPASVPTIPTFYPYLPLDMSVQWGDYVHRHIYGFEANAQSR